MSNPTLPDLNPDVNMLVATPYLGACRTADLNGAYIVGFCCLVEDEEAARDQVIAEFGMSDLEALAAFASGCAKRRERARD